MASTKPDAPGAATPGDTSSTPASASGWIEEPESSYGGATIATGEEVTKPAGVTGPLTRRHEDILDTRNLDLELLSKLGVGASRRLQGECIAIPYVLNGVVVNHKYRTIAGQKRMAQDAGAPKIFWNADAITDPTLQSSALVITEGEFDAIAALQSGIARTVSVPDGAPNKEIGEGKTTKYDYLDMLPGADVLPEVILAVDADAAGTNLMNDLARRIGRLRCKWVTYPKAKDPARRGRDRLKDLNEVLEDYGERGVVLTIQNAKWMAIPGLHRMSELPPIVEPTAYDVGIAGMEDLYRMRLGDFCVVTGVPNHGKSSLVNEVCFNGALNHGWHVTFGSFEQRPQVEHRRNLRTLFNGKWVKFQTAEEIARADEFIEQHFSFITPGDDDDPTLPWFLEAAKAAATRYSARVVVLDPWNEISHQRPPEITLTEYVGESIKVMKRFARNYDVHLIVVAHPSKMRRDRDGKFPMPGLYDISDSANWANKADVGIIVHRESGYVTLRTAKARYPDIGKVGEAKALFDEQALRYRIDAELFQ